MDLKIICLPLLNLIIMKYLSLVFCILINLFNLSCEKIVYVEIPVEEFSRVTLSVYRWSVTHRDGTPYIDAEGKVSNKGPNNISNIRILVSSNFGDTRMTRSSPTALFVDEIGNWAISGVPGTYIQSKAALYDENFD
jgi:hypothetical protein